MTALFPTSDNITQTAVDHVASEARAWKIRQLFIATMLEYIYADFARIPARCMPIKGAYLIQSGVASKMRFRRMDDVDLLVNRADYYIVKAWFLAQDTCRLYEDCYPFKFTVMYEADQMKVLLEIHSTLSQPNRFILPSEVVFDRGILAGKNVVMPSPEDALLLCICHELVHIGHELKSTIFEEMALIIQQQGFSWECFRANALKTGVCRFVELLLRWFERESGISVSFNYKNVYSKIVASIISPAMYGRLPHIFKRIIFELPFVRSPIKLLGEKQSWKKE